MNLQRDIIVRNEPEGRGRPRGSGPRDTNQQECDDGGMRLMLSNVSAVPKMRPALRERPDAHDGVVVGCSGKLS